MAWHCSIRLILNTKICRLSSRANQKRLTSLPWLKETNIITRRPASNIPPRFPHSSRSQTPSFDPDKARKAKPYITLNGVYNILKHRNTKWIGLIAVGGASIFYYQRLEEVPLSRRTRFMYFTEEDALKEGRQAYQEIMQRSGNAILPPSDWRTRKVERVMGRLIEAWDLQHVDWEINVILSNEVNAFVIPGGKVFVHSGILPIAETDSALAAVLSHELAHSILRHHAERMSSQILIIWPLRFAFFWLFDVWSGGIFGNLLLEFGINRPASRVQEMEADHLGLMIMASACYDPKAALIFWKRVKMIEQAQKINDISWLSTHPSSGSRAQSIQKWLPAAEQDLSSILTDFENKSLPIVST
ncbi:hypothetical protein K3495_g13255 [Podosphaera aphanis]|nr:hypothetical protein K3495_g13255 [Podosphaera aphanis]